MATFHLNSAVCYKACQNVAVNNSHTRMPRFAASKCRSTSNLSSVRRQRLAQSIRCKAADDSEDSRFLSQDELKAAELAMKAQKASTPKKPSVEEPAMSYSEEEAPAPGFSSTPFWEEEPEKALAPATAAAISQEEEKTAVEAFLFPDKEELPDDVEMSIWDHFEELRERMILAAAVSVTAVLTCFIFSKDLVVLLEDPVVRNGVRFLQLSPGEYFFTTLKVAGYTGLLVAAPCVLYEVAAFVIPGLTRSERQFLGPIVFGSSILFYTGIFFSYAILTPAALNFFVTYAEGAVESLWSIDQYFEFVLVLMLSTGLSFQVPVIQLLLGATGLVTSQQMLDIWRYVVVGAVVAAAVLTPSTDPFTQMLLAGPLIGLYIGGALAVKAVETSRPEPDALS